MNCWTYGVVPGLLVVGSLLGAAYPQPQEKPASLEYSSLTRVELQPQGTSQKQIYEDIEIYRRLLGKALLSHVHGPQNAYASMKSGNSENLYRSGLGTYYQSFGDPQGLADYVASANFARVNPHAGIVTSPFSIEGFYLRPVGIVISAELPMKFTVSDMKRQPESKKPSDWERERRALNGEKTDKADDNKPRRSPDILETVLRSLAENGHHLSGLKEGQHVTLTLTFRASLGRQCMSCHHVNPQSSNNGVAPNVYPSPSNSTNNAPQSGVASNTGNALWRHSYDFQDASAARTNKPGSTGTTGNASLTADGSNTHALLGDLHFKQGRFEDALGAYNKALEEYNKTISTSLKNLRVSDSGSDKIEVIMPTLDLQNRIIQCYLALKQDDKVEQEVQKLRQWTSLLERVEGSRDVKSQPKGAAPVKQSALPTKVIITASKELLDQAGNGQISFEDFSKKVMVEIMTFDSTAAKP